jgi:hypothetical protein
MTHAFKWVGKRLEFCLAVLAVALLLPLLAFAVVVLRGLVVIAAIVVLGVAAVLYGTYPRFRHWADQLGHPAPRLRVR